MCTLTVIPTVPFDSQMKVSPPVSMCVVLRFIVKFFQTNVLFNLKKNVLNVVYLHFFN